jgi:hypothetical protein
MTTTSGIEELMKSDLMNKMASIEPRLDVLANSPEERRLLSQM